MVAVAQRLRLTKYLYIHSDSKTLRPARCKPATRHAVSCLMSLQNSWKKLRKESDIERGRSMDRWMDKEKEKRGFGPVIGCHRMWKKGGWMTSKEKDGWVWLRESGGEGDRQWNEKALPDSLVTGLSSPPSQSAHNPGNVAWIIDEISNGSSTAPPTPPTCQPPTFS